MNVILWLNLAFRKAAYLGYVISFTIKEPSQITFSEPLSACTEGH